MQPFHIAATGHSLNYLPEYIANRHGFFTTQGLSVTVSVPRPWDHVLDELSASSGGKAAAALGGIWVPSMYRDRVQHYTVFAQVANKSPLTLLKRRDPEQREKAGKFKVTDIVAGKTVLMKSGGGASVGMYFKMLLREHGVDPRTVDYIQDLDGVMLGKLFQGGMGDYFVTDSVSGRVMAQKYPDTIEIAMEMVTSGGEIPWSVYYCETGTITPEVVDKQRRFCAAVMQGMEWVLEHDAEAFKEELAEIFPNAPIDVVVALTNTYRKDGMWTTPVVSRVGFERWQRGIADARLIEKPLKYEMIVDGTATKGIAEEK